MLESSAPHLYQASRRSEHLNDWGEQPDCTSGPSRSSGICLKRGLPEVSMWRCTPGEWPLTIPHHELCYFASGSATYTSESGEVIEIEPDMLVHFKTGWTGRCQVRETMHVTFMTCEGQPAQPGQPTPVLRGIQSIQEVKAWGMIPTMVEGESLTSGVLLSRDSDQRAESGIWICSPGTWNCHVTSDEFCHFLLGRCTYTHESGESIEVQPDTLAFFPQDWKGVCQVHETVRKVYLIR